MEKVLFNSDNIYVTTEVIEYDGKKYDPSTLIDVIIEKDGSLQRNLIISAVIAFFGITLIFKDWTTFGSIIFVIGALGSAFFYYSNQDVRATTFITISFTGGRHTGNRDVIVLTIESYIKSYVLKGALIAALKSKLDNV